MGNNIFRRKTRQKVARAVLIVFILCLLLPLTATGCGIKRDYIPYEKSHYYDNVNGNIYEKTDGVLKNTGRRIFFEGNFSGEN